METIVKQREQHPCQHVAERDFGERCTVRHNNLIDGKGVIPGRCEECGKEFTWEADGEHVFGRWIENDKQPLGRDTRRIGYALMGIPDNFFDQLRDIWAEEDKDSQSP